MATKSKNKTAATAVDPIAFIDKVANEIKRRDSHELVAMMHGVVGEPPKMWGPTIVGFGTLHYRYGSGREGDICLMGFSPRSSGLVLYIGPTLEDAIGSRRSPRSAELRGGISHDGGARSLT